MADSDAANGALDPGGFFEFDLARGAVRDRSGARLLLLSDAVVAPLVDAAVRNGDVTAVRKLGRQLGDAAMNGMDLPPPDASPEVVLGRAAEVLSLFGWGRLEVERWGDALLARVRGLPSLDGDHLGVAALLGGLFSALADRDVACVPISRDGAFLLVHPSIAGQIWKWSRSGETVGRIVERLAAPEVA
jgi:hypothetical protein